MARRHSGERADSTGSTEKLRIYFWQKREKFRQGQLQERVHSALFFLSSAFASTPIRWPRPLEFRKSEPAPTQKLLGRGVAEFFCLPADENFAENPLF
jgi:hypothetical protein